MKTIVNIFLVLVVIFGTTAEVKGDSILVREIKRRTIVAGQIKEEIRIINLYVFETQSSETETQSSKFGSQPEKMRELIRDFFSKLAKEELTLIKKENGKEITITIKDLMINKELQDLIKSLLYSDIYYRYHKYDINNIYLILK